MACLEQDLEACLVYLKFPKDHHKSIRTTNLLERTFGEGRRRTKVIPRFPTETACLKLVFATLLTAAQRWRGVRMTPRILRELDALRQERYPVQSQVA
jgi:transposase-like protein